MADKHKTWMILSITLAAVLILSLFLYSPVKKALVGEAMYLDNSLFSEPSYVFYPPCDLNSTSEGTQCAADGRVCVWSYLIPNELSRLYSTRPYRVGCCGSTQCYSKVNNSCHNFGTLANPQSLCSNNTRWYVCSNNNTNQGITMLGYKCSGTEWIKTPQQCHEEAELIESACYKQGGNSDECYSLWSAAKEDCLCYDPDYGIDPNIKTEVWLSVDGYYDKCADDNTVTEYYCYSDTEVESANITCDPGYVCRDGACVEESTVIERCDSKEDEDHDGLIDCHDDDCFNHSSCKVDLNCPSGYATGIQGRSGWYIAGQVKLICDQGDSSGVAGTSTTDGSPFTFNCPDGKYLTGFQYNLVNYSKYIDRIARLRPICDGVVQTTSYGWGGSATTTKSGINLKCNSNQAIKLLGTSAGLWLNKLYSVSCEAITYSCTGTVPSDANLCPNSDTGLTIDTTRTLNSSCTSGTKCQYTCDSGYKLSNNVCVEEDDDETSLLGDVDGDGEITAIDAVLILRHTTGKYELTEEQKKAADVNCDSQVTTIDAVLVLRHDLGKITSFPCP